MRTDTITLPPFLTDWQSSAPQFVSDFKDCTLQCVTSLSAETQNFHVQGILKGDNRALVLITEDKSINEVVEHLNFY